MEKMIKTLKDCLYTEFDKLFVNCKSEECIFLIFEMKRILSNKVIYHIASSNLSEIDRNTVLEEIRGHVYYYLGYHNDLGIIPTEFEDLFEILKVMIKYEITEA